MELTTSRVRAATHRLIASRWPTVGIFDDVASPEDLEAVLLLEGWTNDRLSALLGTLHRIPREEWTIGETGSHIVMAAFCHPSPGGGRFSTEQVGAWCCSPEIETALVETIHHHRRRLAAAPGLEFRARFQMRQLLSDLDADFHDLRGTDRPEFYAPDSYAKSQPFAEALRRTGSNGIVHDSVRRRGGTCLAVFRPKLVPPVVQGDHYEYVWSGSPEPDVVKLSNVAI